MLCKASRAQFLDKDIEIWLAVGLMQKVTMMNQSSEWNNGHGGPSFLLPIMFPPSSTVKLALETIFELLQDIINEHMEMYAPGEELIWLAILTLKLTIASTATDWFSSCVVPNVAKKSLSGINPTGL